MFVLLPDVVYDSAGTYDRARLYLPHLRYASLPVAFALQEGFTWRQVENIAPDYVFIGCSRKWKWAKAEDIVIEAHNRGMPVHIGMVNGPNRVASALRVGADSVDGTGFSAFSDEMLPGLFRVMEGESQQMKMEI